MKLRKDDVRCDSSFSLFSLVFVRKSIRCINKQCHIKHGMNDWNEELKIPSDN